jgi:hypothetical protein
MLDIKLINGLYHLSRPKCVVVPPNPEPPPLDELGEPCPICGGKDKWRWLDDRMVCRACLIRRDPPPTAATAAIPAHRRRRPWW